LHLQAVLLFYIRRIMPYQRTLVKGIATGLLFNFRGGIAAERLCNRAQITIANEYDMGETTGAVRSRGPCCRRSALSFYFAAYGSGSQGKTRDLRSLIDEEVLVRRWLRRYRMCQGSAHCHLKHFIGTVLVAPRKEINIV
jgi:hypothetical protein